MRRNWNSCEQKRTQSSARRDRRADSSAQAKTYSTAGSRSLTASMLLAVMPAKPRVRATASRSIGSVEPARAPLPSGERFIRLRRSVEPAGVALEPLDEVQQVCPSQDRLGPLHVRVARHDGYALALRPCAPAPPAGRGWRNHDLVDRIAQPQPQIQGDLVVARAGGVQPLAGLADAVGQFRLDGHVDVAVGEVELELAGLDVLGDREHALFDGLEVLGLIRPTFGASRRGRCCRRCRVSRADCRPISDSTNCCVSCGRGLGEPPVPQGFGFCSSSSRMHTAPRCNAFCGGHARTSCVTWQPATCAAWPLYNGLLATDNRRLSAYNPQLVASQVFGAQKPRQESTMAANILDGKQLAGQIRQDVTTEVEAIRQPRWAAAPSSWRCWPPTIPAPTSTPARKRRPALTSASTSSCSALRRPAHRPTCSALVDRLERRPSRDRHHDPRAAAQGRRPDGPAERASGPRRTSKPPARPASGLLVHRQAVLLPSTPAAAFELARMSPVPMEGAKAVIIGRSVVVGKPLALMLIDAHCTVTVCHTRTKDLPAVARQADFLFVAAGRPRIVGADYIKPGAVVVDIGINQVTEPGPDGKDADPDRR